MKLSQLSILFVCIMIMMVISVDIRTDNLTAMADTKSDMNYYMDQAMESSVKALMQKDSETGELVMNKDAAVDSYYSSMFASLGILSDPVAQEKFRAYIPVIAVMDVEGYYLMYNDEYVGTDGYSYISRRWTEKTPYSYEDEDFIYRFTLNEDFILYDKNRILDTTGTIKLFELNIQALRTQTDYTTIRAGIGSDSFLLDQEKFEAVRQQAIISHIEKDLSWYISKHNEIAARFGITYQFALPVTDTSDWAKTIEGLGIVIMFQGMPLVEDTDKVYNRTAFTGAGVRKDRVYYIEQHEWYYRYHREGCPLLVGNLNIRDEHYTSVEEVSALGAFSCMTCDPLGVQPPEYTP